MKTVIGILLAIVVAVPALAGPPTNGVYQSTDLGGTMLPGRYSESWPAINSGATAMGNTTNKMSWDGATLGGEWWMYCAEVSLPPQLINDTVDVDGNGSQQWLTTYSGGLCILDGNGPWGDGSEVSYIAPYTSYTETNTIQFANFVVTAVVSSASLQAQILGFSDACMSLSISNQEQASTTQAGALPGDYPGFLDPNSCGVGRVYGSWGEADEFTMVITGCTVPTEEATWGSIKHLYE